MTAKDGTWRDFYCGYCNENTGWIFTLHLGWLPCNDCNRLLQKAQPEEGRAVLIEIEALTNNPEI